MTELHSTSGHQSMTEPFPKTRRVIETAERRSIVHEANRNRGLSVVSAVRNGILHRAGNLEVKRESELRALHDDVVDEFVHAAAGLVVRAKPAIADLRRRARSGVLVSRVLFIW
jgi:hypothetical protein